MARHPCGAAVRPAAVEPQDAPAHQAWAGQVVGAPVSWPPIQLRLVWRPPRADAHAIAPAADRDEARVLVRRLLRQHAGPALANRLDACAADQRGGQPVSVSHDGRLSLVAWCHTGRLGVDLVDLASLADASPAELQDTARCYLGPDAAQALGLATDAPTGTGLGPADPAAQHTIHALRLRFAAAWASQEARLKCLGLALDEWSPARSARLDAQPWAEVAVAHPQPAAPPWGCWLARLAWSPPHDRSRGAHNAGGGPWMGSVDFAPSAYIARHDEADRASG